MITLCSIDWPGFFSSLKDLVIAGAAVTTALVAVIGLKKWRDELHGKANFEVARGLARATFGLREAIQSARSPLMRVAVPPPNSTASLVNPYHDPSRELEGYARAYKERWDQVATALKEFDAQALEAEALWGTELRKDASALRQCAVTLFVSIEAILDDRAADGDHFKSDREFGRRMRANAHASPEATDNELSNQIAAAVSVLEGKLRARLSRKSERAGSATDR